MTQFQSRGFTLFEMLATVGIISILATSAVPSFSHMMKRDRLVADINRLHSVFKFARSEAVKRDTEISLVATNSSKWKVIQNAGTDERTVLLQFIPSDSSVQISGLADLIISSSGSTSALDIQLSDDDQTTDDYRLCIFLSGQSIITTAAQCP
ncbi:hypothetical protein ND16A_2707 [Thalassotalea sp. ND16A]|nr:hypothetical protein ND16A_2707 [Thalassotalea sp. ND16A]